MKQIKFKADLLAKFRNGDFIVKNEVGGIEALKELFKGVATLALNPSSQFYNNEGNGFGESFALSCEKPIVSLYSLLELPCGGACEFCKCDAPKYIDQEDKRQIIAFEANVKNVNEQNTSFSAMVIKGEEAGSWASLCWFPLSKCKYSVVGEKFIVQAPLWLLEDRKIQYCITLYEGR